MRPRDAEVDVEVKRRKRIVQQVRTAERMLAADGDAQFDELLDRTSTIIDQFLRPLAILSRPEGCDAIDDLLAAAQALEQLVLDAAVPRLRPYRRIGLVLSDVCDLVRDSLNRTDSRDPVDPGAVGVGEREQVAAVADQVE